LVAVAVPANVEFCEVSTVIAVVPADCKVNAVADADESELIVGVVIVGLVANTLLPVPVLVTLTKPLDASVATALDAVKLE
jgi:hypothetical protein